MVLSLKRLLSDGDKSKRIRRERNIHDLPFPSIREFVGLGEPRYGENPLWLKRLLKRQGCSIQDQRIQSKLSQIVELVKTVGYGPNAGGLISLRFAVYPILKKLTYLLVLPDIISDFIIGKVVALLSLLDAEFDADHIREKRKRTSGSGGQFFRLIFSKYSKLILPFSFR